MKTVISHFYNEEYLLPYWLKHHRQYFDHGIMINYNSTDNSINIIKELCPTWDIVDTENEKFSVQPIDLEVMKYESNLDGFRICLNITEFLIGNFNILDLIHKPTQLIIPTFLMVDEYSFESSTLNDNIPLIEQRTWGIDELVTHTNKPRACRSMHNFAHKYKKGGRHYFKHNTTEFRIMWYGFSPYNEQQIKRKTQFDINLPAGEVEAGLHLDHLMSLEQLDAQYSYYKTFSSNLSKKIKAINKV